MKILLIIYDNNSYIHYFPLGIAYISSVLRNNKYDFNLYFQDVNHFNERHLSEYIKTIHFDVIAIGFIAGYFQFDKLLRISQVINRTQKRPQYYILGGHGPSPEPEYFLKKMEADIIVHGEGEITFIELLNTISDKGDFSKVKGISYKQEDKVLTTPKREVIKDIDSIPWPAYDLFPIEYYRLMRLPHTSNRDFSMPVLSSRGCPFHCTFCYRMDTSYRMRNSEDIVDEVQYLQKNYGITYIDFTDELLMSSKERVYDICETIIRKGISFKWFCNGRLNYASSDVLDLMKKAGCVFINYGIEALDDKVLLNMNKALTTNQIIKGIESTLKSGISPGFNILFGNIGDNKETLEKAVQFLIKYDDGAQLRTIRPVTPYPGSKLFSYAIEKGLLKNCEDFYENKHINSDLLTVNFTDMNDDDFYKSLLEANNALLENYYSKKLNSEKKITKDLYLNKNKEFRGFRHT